MPDSIHFRHASWKADIIESRDAWHRSVFGLALAGVPLSVQAWLSMMSACLPALL